MVHKIHKYITWLQALMFVSLVRWQLKDNCSKSSELEHCCGFLKNWDSSCCSDTFAPGQSSLFLPSHWPKSWQGCQMMTKPKCSQLLPPQQDYRNKVVMISNFQINLFLKYWELSRHSFNFNKHLNAAQLSFFSKRRQLNSNFRAKKKSVILVLYI